MPTDLFSRLFRYRPTHGRLPWEDWFTESFVAVLDRYPKLGVAYASHLIGRDVDTADIETQRTFDNARPDMWVDSAWDDCGMTDALGETDGRGWFKTELERQRSPRIVRHDIHIELGFDFFREDAEWDVSRLQMPSAWVGIWMREANGTCTLACPSGWKAPPKTWEDGGGGRWVWVCEIDELRMRGESLSALYVEFFTGAFTALKAVL